MKCEQHKVRKSKLPEEVIKEIAELLTERSVCFAEIEKISKRAGCGSGIESVLSLLQVRGYQVAEITISKGSSKKTLYKIVTKEDYEKYEREATRDAKRRLLETVSSGSTF